ncbi:hypothetical protein PENSPDRAFT_682116 [Peniophora sp. CONT]|nr:hypothetical protein PENSPDRAFT_682116 [Peniophora sp. CONT]
MIAGIRRARHAIAQAELALAQAQLALAEAQHAAEEVTGGAVTTLRQSPPLPEHGGEGDAAPMTVDAHGGNNIAALAYADTEQVNEAELGSMHSVQKAATEAEPVSGGAEVDTDSDTELWAQLKEGPWVDIDTDDACATGEDHPLLAETVETDADSDMIYWSALTEGPYTGIDVNDTDSPLQIETAETGADARAAEFAVNVGGRQNHTGRRSVLDISVDDAAQRTAEGSQAHPRHVSARNAEIERYDRPRSLKRKATENDIEKIAVGKGAVGQAAKRITTHHPSSPAKNS